MTINSTGPVSIGGTLVGQSINLELNRSATQTSNLNETALRMLANVPSGTITINNFHGKSSTVLYSLSNTATDPTSTSWRLNNPGYTFSPNVGIRTVGPITDARFMFEQNVAFNDPDVADWDTSTFTRTVSMFGGATAFNQNIGAWDMSNVTQMQYMFYSAGQNGVFNQNIGAWNVQKVTNMSFMLYGALAFNQDIGGWNLASLTNMSSMLSAMAVFNQDISGWNVFGVTDMSYLFAGSPVFNCGQASGVPHNLMNRTALAGWRTNNVTTMQGMRGMFGDASAFNGNLDNWCVTLIPSVPTDFALRANANFTVARQPTWGACPIP